MSLKIPKALLELSPTMYAATSLVAKDIVGCVIYTSTSRANKQYTPEKRSDVSNYDLANGVINVGLQLLAIKPLDKLMTKLTDSKVVKHFYNGLDEKLGNSDNKLVMNLLKRKAAWTKGFAALTSIIICQYVIKRFISPFFSMPAGDKLAE